MDDREFLRLVRRAIDEAVWVSRKRNVDQDELMRCDALIDPLVRIERELHFRPLDRLHSMMREVVRLGWDYLERGGDCPMRAVLDLERELYFMEAVA